MRLCVRISYDPRLYKKKNWFEHQVTNIVKLVWSKSWSEKKSNLVWVHLDDKAWGWSQLISQCLEFNCRAVALLATENIWRKERVRWPNRAPTKWSHLPKSAEHFVPLESFLAFIFRLVSCTFTSVMRFWTNLSLPTLKMNSIQTETMQSFLTRGFGRQYATVELKIVALQLPMPWSEACNLRKLCQSTPMSESYWTCLETL